MSARSFRRVGVAIGRDEVWAVPLDRRGQPVRGAEFLMYGFEQRSSGKGSQEQPTESELRTAFDETKRRLDVEQVAAHVAFLPSIAQGRRLELPRLRSEERRRVLARYAGKYFLGARGPQLVTSTVISASAASPQQVFATSSPVSLVDRVFSAAEACGWRIDSSIAAFDAWAAAAAMWGPKSNGRERWIVLCERGALDALCVQERRPVLFRRLRGHASDRSSARSVDWQAVLAPNGGAGLERLVLLVGEDDACMEVAEELATVQNAHAVRVGRDGATSPGALAAGFAAVPRSDQVLPEAIRVEGRRRSRRVTARLSAAAMLALVAAGALELWGTHRELTALSHRRTAIRAAVDSAMTEREVLLGLNERLEVLQLVQTTAPRWSEIVAAVADHLPSDAHLTAFRAAADSLVLEGVADRAAGVFEAMRTTPGVLGVRATAPIRRELRQGEESIERFTLAARLSIAFPEVQQ